jgi:hypothetical protein
MPNSMLRHKKYRPKITKYFSFFTLTFSLFCLFNSIGGSAMTWGTLVLCSEFNGKLINEQGEAVPNVKIIRRWKWEWASKTGEEVTYTDDQGKFSFEQVNGSSFSARIIPHEPGIDTEVVAFTENKEVTLFAIEKSNYSVDGELNDTALKGPGINLKCRSDLKPGVHEGPFWGTCVADE